MKMWFRASLTLVLGITLAAPLSGQRGGLDMTTFERPIEMHNNEGIEELTTLGHGRRLIEFRADITVDAIHRVIAERGR